MIKRYLLIALTICCAMVLIAGPVNKGNARQIANQFLQKQGKSVKHEPVRAPQIRGEIGVIDEGAAYYVFDTDDNQGFVIVSGDDRTEPILGYSTNGAFDEDNMPDNLKAWLQGYADQIELIATGKAMPAKVPLHSEDIAQKMSTTWNQSYPYNGLCNFNSTLCVTGCTATAISQVMNWNQWPQDATTSIPGYTTRKNSYDIPALAATTFDWANMINDYSSGYTTEQATAVAYLMRYVGQAAKMDYGPSSGASFGNVIYALVNYFGYDDDIRYVKATGYTIAQWDAMIYDELKLRPVPYEGYSTGGGHAFVIDGYNSSDGTYYVNWGWGGLHDGYYRLRVMDAKGGGIGASSTSDGYAQNQGAIFDMKKDDGTHETSGRYFRGYMSMETDGKAMRLYVQNPYCEDITFENGIAMLNSDGSVKEVFDISSQSYSYSGYYSKGYIPDPNYGMTADNTYKFAFVSREQGDTEWKKAYDEKCYFEVVFRSYDDYDIIVHPKAELVVTGDEINGSLRAMDVHTYNVTLRNDGEEFNNNLYFFLQTPDDSEMKLLSRTSLALESNATDGVSFPFTPSAPGIYSYKVTTDEDGTNILADGDQEIGKEKFLATELSYGVKDDSKLYISFENNGDVDYNYYFLVVLYYKNSSGEYVTEEQYWSSRTLIPAGGGTGEATFDIGSGKATNDYMAHIYYKNDYDSDNPDTYYRVLQDIYFTVGSDGKALVGIEEVTTDTTSTTDGKYYTIDGMLLSGKPAKKGIYIRNGKKVAM